MQRTHKNPFLTFGITLGFLLVLALPAFADKANATVVAYTGVPATHPYRYTTTRTSAASQQVVLNAYTSAPPIDGTPVTTWKYTGSDTQEWSAGGDVTVDAYDSATYYNGEVISNNANPDVGLNINRSYSTPEVNVYSLIGNKFADVVILHSGTSYWVEPRAGVGRRYLQRTSSIPNSGGGQYMRWGTSPSPFYCFDISYNSFT